MAPAGRLLLDNKGPTASEALADADRTVGSCSVYIWGAKAIESPAVASCACSFQLFSASYSVDSKVRDKGALVFEM